MNATRPRRIVRRAVMALAGVVLLASGFSCRDAAFSVPAYKKAIRSGLSQIPEARQMEELWGDADHSISYHGARSIGNDWSTEVYLYDRYVLAMQVPVRMGYSFDEVLEVLGKPNFYLLEVRSVEYHGNDGIPGATIERNDWPYPFTADEWAKVYAAKGDFSVIGIELKLDAPVDGFDDYMNAERRGHIDME